ncbi:hypothetical protein BDA99DRAFT_504925 [Phascolomyces articulosus]|uniref:Uncharacterized protein n=1 Tax=Phascolomyces articulosus TaxID=60185 RepID=A0AAD5PHG5_9FUNG|nr:hypothetical protein BDA99DRAFT_504925 [Phascolomyces articulosus]
MLIDNDQQRQDQGPLDEKELSALESTIYDTTSAIADLEDSIQEQEGKDQKEAMPRPEAIFLHGLDEMSTKDIRAYCNNLPLEKIEWINDTSCNLVFADEEGAQQAIDTLLASDIQDPVTHHILRKAKAYTQENSDHVFNNLHIRIATTWDVKEPGARDRSRYYLLHGGDDAGGRYMTTTKPFDRSELPKGGIFDRLGKRKESRPNTRRHHPYQQQDKRRRSLSPRPPRSSSGREEEQGNRGKDVSIQIPDSLKGRIGSRRPR